MSLELLEPREMMATEITTLSSLGLLGSDRTLIEIGGLLAGDPPGGNDSDGYDRIQVTSNAALAGTLEVRLVNGYVPEVGQTFDFLTVGGTRSGAFASAEGLFSFPDGDRYFDVVTNGNGLRLEVKAAPGGLKYAPPAGTRDAFGKFLSDYFSVTQFGYTGELSVGGFASFSGNLAFQEVGGETLVAASGVNVQLGSATNGVQITGASFGLVLPGDGTYALEATGSGSLTGIPGFTLSGTMFAERNTTGAGVNRTITVDGKSATIDVAAGAKRFAGTDLDLTISGFVDVTGDVGFDVSGSDVIAVASNVTATMTAGSFSVGVTGGTLGLVATAADTTAFEVRGGVSLSGGGFASASATEALVRYNDTDTAYTAQTVTVGGVAYTFEDLPQATDLKVVSVTGLDATFANLFDVAGDFGFAKNGSVVHAAAQNAEVTLGNATYTVGVTGGSLGLVIDADGKKALEASGSITFTGGDFASASATAVKARYNETGTLYTGDTVTAGDVSYTFTDLPASTTLQSVSATGLSVDINGFVNLTGDLGFQKVGGDIRAVAQDLDATLGAGGFAAKVNAATGALLLHADGTRQVYATGDFNLTGGDFASASGAAIVTENTSPGAFAAQDVTVDGITVSVPALAGSLQSVTVTDLNATVVDFVTLRGDFGLEKTAGGDLEVVGNSVSAQLEVGPAVQVGVTGATLGLLLKADETMALQSTGGAVEPEPGRAALRRPRPRR